MDNIDDELQFHLDEKIRDLMAQGLSREAATGRAERELGDRSAIRQSVRRSSLAADASASGNATGWDGAKTRATRSRFDPHPQFSVPSIVIFALGVGLPPPSSRYYTALSSTRFPTRAARSCISSTPPI